MRIWPQINVFAPCPTYLARAVKHIENLEGKPKWKEHAIALLCSITPDSNWKCSGRNAKSRSPRLPSPDEIVSHLHVDLTVLTHHGYFLKRNDAIDLLRENSISPKLLSAKVFQEDGYRNLFRRPPTELNKKTYVYTFQEIAFWVESQGPQRLLIDVPTVLQQFAVVKPKIQVKV